MDPRYRIQGLKLRSGKRRFSYSVYEGKLLRGAKRRGWIGPQPDQWNCLWVLQKILLKW